MKNILLAICTGLLLAISWPTYGFPIFLFIGFVPLLLIAHTVRNHRRHKSLVFGYAFLSFFIWNIGTTWWIYNSTAFGMWFAEIVNTLLMALVFLSYHTIARRTSTTISTIFLIAIWISFEYLHLHWEFSWPWLNLGNGFAKYTSWIQWYEYTGTFGGTLWIWIVNTYIFHRILAYRKHANRKSLINTVAISSALVLIPIGISLLILANYTEEGQEIEVVMLQPNINPYTEKYNTTDERVGELLDSLVNTQISNETQFIIAPETVFADNNRLKKFNNSIAKKTAKTIIANHPKAHMLSGISFIDVFRDPARVHAQTNIHKENIFYDDYNAAFFVRPDHTHEIYNKSKLVVGVENFPYQYIFKPILGDAMIDLGGTVAKKTTQTDREVFFTKDSIGAAPIICYESVYGEFVGGYVRNHANFLAIITNDAWWGNTQGHQQHLYYAKLRAIETRRSVARSANTGISAIINQKGEITTTLGYELQGALKGTLLTNDRMTFYVTAGDYIARIALFLTVGIFLLAITRRRQSIN